MGFFDIGTPGELAGVLTFVMLDFVIRIVITPLKKNSCADISHPQCNS